MHELAVGFHHSLFHVSTIMLHMLHLLIKLYVFEMYLGEGKDKFNLTK